MASNRERPDHPASIGSIFGADPEYALLSFFDHPWVFAVNARKLKIDVKGNYMSDEMKAGTVKFFNTTKGFGFIQPDGGGDDVFVHITALQRGGLQGLNEGDKVHFNTAVNERTGKTAVDSIAMA